MLREWAALSAAAAIFAKATIKRWQGNPWQVQLPRLSWRSHCAMAIHRQHDKSSRTTGSPSACKLARCPASQIRPASELRATAGALVWHPKLPPSSPHQSPEPHRQHHQTAAHLQPRAPDLELLDTMHCGHPNNKATTADFSWNMEHKRC